MNSQTKNVAIAATVGLALAVLVQIPKVASRGYIAPLDPFYPFNGGMLGYWIGALGFFPVVAILVTVAVTARKAGWGRSLLNGLGAIAAVCLVICTAVVATASLQPMDDHPFAKAGAARADFVSNATSGCATRQKALPESKDVPAAAIQALCACFANSFADVTTLDEFRYLAQNHAPSSSAMVKINAAQQKCAQEASVRKN